jgi:hypothetical protein
MEYCKVCECAVPSANWDQHVNGKRHQSIVEDNSETQSNSDSDNSNDKWYDVVDEGSIAYKQDSIKNEFRDGTTLLQGIANLQSLPGHYKHCNNWDGEDPEHVVNVWSLGNDGYVADNSRTLYCYLEAGFSWIPICVMGEFTGRRTFEDVRVRRGY